MRIQQSCQLDQKNNGKCPKEDIAECGAERRPGASFGQPANQQKDDQIAIQVKPREERCGDHRQYEEIVEGITQKWGNHLNDKRGIRLSSCLSIRIFGYGQKLLADGPSFSLPLLLTCTIWRMEYRLEM